MKTSFKDLINLSSLYISVSSITCSIVNYGLTIMTFLQFSKPVVRTSGSQSIFSSPARAVSPENVANAICANLWTLTQACWNISFRVGLRNVCFNKPSRWEPLNFCIHWFLHFQLFLSLLPFLTFYLFSIFQLKFYFFWGIFPDASFFPLSTLDFLIINSSWLPAFFTQTNYYKVWLYIFVWLVN